MTSETEEIKKLQKTISELQVELRFLQETVGVLMGAMMEDGESAFQPQFYRCFEHVAALQPFESPFDF